MEILLNNTAIASTIRVGKIESMDNTLLTSRAEGMLTLDESIKHCCGTTRSAWRRPSDSPARRAGSKLRIWRGITW